MTNTNSDLKQAVLDVLDEIIHPNTSKGLIKSQRIQGLSIQEGGQVGFILEVDNGPSPEADSLQKHVEEALSKIDGVSKVTIVLTSHSETPQPPKASGATHRMHKGDNTASKDARGPSKPSSSTAQRTAIPGVNAMIAVASAKGGVGKSSVTVNLAIACAQLGLKVGILDTDVYGPSIPTMLGTSEVQPEQNKEGKLFPIEAHGLKTMSIGYLVDSDAPMIWRGPVVVSAINQMMSDVEWGHIDVLFVDTPPGTGDIQLSLTQRAPLSGAVIVSTPQEIALADVRRGVAMFKKTHTPVFGIIENMAWFEDPVSKNRTHIFGEGGARKTAEALEIPFLGELPIVPQIREDADSGTPAAITAGPVQDSFRAIAEKIIASLEAPQGKAPPKIVFE
ncbi:Mrp/NBP35 family ATP-binding protein [Hirschia maritima]|uniref:Mrp/NBP35 family ATP-binding protein n=1 Tax=Hirschia maritima TaxID=1121961 RepID=UPI00037A3714|nr:Mrp/NBP35 family ATP-binding protein [Hirschia maritima]